MEYILLILVAAAISMRIIAAIDARNYSKIIKKYFEKNLAPFRTKDEIRKTKHTNKKQD